MDFHASKPLDYVVIIGCGRLGANLANALSERGDSVLIMDKDKNSFRKLAPSFGGLSIVGDGIDFDVLKESKIEEADAVIIVTNNDNANIMIAQISREIFHVKRVITRLYDPERELVYKEFGIDTICPSVLSTIEIEKILSGENTGFVNGNRLLDRGEVSL